MKTLQTLIAIILITSFQAKAQKAGVSTVQLLNAYYEVKNALVRSDNSLAEEKASVLAGLAADLEVKTSQADKTAGVKIIVSRLISDAQSVGLTKDLNRQRAGFAALSADIYSLAKSLPLSDKPIYRVYCPMKKSYWLSADPAIKNPYYGTAMLTCGKVSETINP
ncbi:DUF3347 domain-containing protein [Inquilinus sp. KBS0705]|nr:DUF3347 domain-containing protein [Inquilinus sp. KBS0705]